MEAKQVLQNLIKNGTITEDDVEKIQAGEVTEESVIHLFHTLMCKANHDENCHYYSEQQMELAEAKPSHLYWTERYRTIRDKLSTDIIDKDRYMHFNLMQVIKCATDIKDETVLALLAYSIIGLP